MASDPIASATVFVAKPFEISYADAMRRLRTWLDHKKIQPAAFKIATEARIGFEITPRMRITCGFPSVRVMATTPRPLPQRRRLRKRTIFA